jgi:hypothetical protein
VRRNFLLPLPGLPPDEDLKIRRTALKWARRDAEISRKEDEPLFEDQGKRGKHEQPLP